MCSVLVANNTLFIPGFHWQPRCLTPSVKYSGDAVSCGASGDETASFSHCSLTAHLNLTLRGITKAEAVHAHRGGRNIFSSCQVLSAFCNSFLIPRVDVMDLSEWLAALTGLSAQFDILSLHERRFNLWQTQQHCSLLLKINTTLLLINPLCWAVVSFKETHLGCTTVLAPQCYIMHIGSNEYINFHNIHLKF